MDPVEMGEQGVKTAGQEPCHENSGPLRRSV